jgi:hypothetical protein
MVESYLEQHQQHIENKDIDACKKFISNYVEQVTAYKDEIEVKILLDIDGGGGGPYHFKSTAEKHTLKKRLLQSYMKPCPHNMSVMSAGLSCHLTCLFQ